MTSAHTVHSTPKPSDTSRLQFRIEFCSLFVTSKYLICNRTFNRIKSNSRNALFQHVLAFIGI